MIKVFYGTRLMELGDDARRVNGKKSVCITKKLELYLVLNKYFKSKTQPDLVICGYNNKKLFTDFKSYFSQIHAAGGIVKNEKKQVLFIKRKRVWDLPKGKLNKGEKPKRGAQREIREETGVGKLIVGEQLAPTYHIFKRRGELFLKKTDWFFMESKGKVKLVPQKSENITRVVWMDKKKALAAIDASYRSLRESFRYYIEN